MGHVVLSRENGRSCLRTVRLSELSAVNTHQPAARRLRNWQGLGNEGQHGGIQSEACHLRGQISAEARDAAHWLDFETIPPARVWNPLRTRRVRPILLMQLKSFHAKMPVGIVERSRDSRLGLASS